MKDYDSAEAVLERANQEDPIVMYLIVRESLGMSCGKIAAQCAHASQMILLKYMYLDRLLDANLGFLGKTNPNNGVYEADFVGMQKLKIMELWLNSSFRKVVLEADEKEWLKIKEQYSEDYRALVIDAGLTELNPNTETVVSLWPMKKSERSKLIKRLRVLK